MKNKTARIALGVFLMLIAIYGGAFALEFSPSWLEFANFATAAMVFVAGVFLIIFNTYPEN